MADIVERLRAEIPHRLIEKHWTVDFDALDAERAEAAAEIQRLRNAMYQYRDDLHYPPSADSVQRRLKMIDDVLEGK